MKEDIYLESGRNKSAIIRKAQEKSSVSTKVLAETIGVTEGTFRNKLFRNYFTWDEMIKIIERCDGKILIKL